MQGVLYVQIVLFKLLDSLMFQGQISKTNFENFYGKLCFVNYLVNKKGLSSSVTRTIKYSLDYTVMVSFSC